jgi:hypothetical protein
MADIDIPLFSTPEGYRRPVDRRRLAAMLSTVYSIPRDHAVAIEPIVIEFSVVDPVIRRTGGWVAGGKKVRPMNVHKTVRPRA